MVIYSLSVLLAKVKVILKRFDGLPLDDTTKEIRRNTISVNLDTRRIYVNGEEVQLKNKEFKLFVYLYNNRNRVVTKEELFANVWGDEFFSDGTLNVHIRKIREKIEENPNDPHYIKTIWGIGYILEL